MSPSKSHYLSITETARRLGISRQAVLNRIKRGTLRAERIGHTWAVLESTVETKEKNTRFIESLPEHADICIGNRFFAFKDRLRS